MSKPDRMLREIARRVLKMQLAAGSSGKTAYAEAMQRSCGELYRILETAMGPLGLQALIDRAIQIAAREYPWLTSVKTGAAADCPLSGLAEAAERLNVADATEGYAFLLASMIWLLMTFIGEDLTLRFVRTAWPAVSFSKLSEGPRND
ncbi:MAG: hypothetical protein ACJ74H_14915 [Thermoanaerobaculia bacterium]